MIDINALARKNIRELIPYSSARDEYGGEGNIFLDANENSLGSAVEQNLNRYPDPHQRTLKEKIGAMKSLAVDQIFLGNGSDEAIDLLIRTFCEPGMDKVMIMPPTYGMYEVCANINDVQVLKVPLTRDFEIDAAGVLNSKNENVKLVFLCSPNNPSGNVFNQAAVSQILSDFKGLVIIDEAYIDFTPAKSWLDKLPRYRNLVVLQTFSKAWGLADIRLGMAFGAPEIIQLLDKIKYPYNVNGLTLGMAARALDNLHIKEAMVKTIIAERSKLEQNLNRFAMIKKVYPSDANFLLVKFDRADVLYKRLRECGIVVRDRSQAFHCEDCLRITVGSPAENENLIETLEKIETEL